MKPVLVADLSKRRKKGFDRSLEAPLQRNEPSNQSMIMRLDSLLLSLRRTRACEDKEWLHLVRMRRSVWAEEADGSLLRFQLIRILDC